MPPKIKITRERILDEAFALCRQEGFQKINARNLSKALDCSTQPILYHFKTMDALKKALYRQVDQFHSDYLMHIHEGEDFMLGVGLNYIRFAMEEPELFLFLFQSGYATGGSLPEIIDAPELLPLLTGMQQAMELTLAQTKEVFLTIALFAHGYASMIANHHLSFDEKTAAVHLENAYNGAILAAKEKEHEKTV